MFWRFGFHTQSAIDTLLDREDVTIEEVLNEEELIQECKTHNRKLVDYLCRADVLEKLLGFISQQPESEVGESDKYRNACLAAEIFGCEVLAICDALLKHEGLLSKFWKLLDHPSTLNPILGSYFCRVFILLLHKKTQETIAFLQAQEDSIQKIINHIDTSAAMDLISKIIISEEAKEGRGVLQWVIEQEIVEKLIEKFDPHLPPEMHSNAATILMDMMHIVQRFGAKNPVIERLKSAKVQTRLLTLICERDAPNIATAISGALNVQIELIQRGLGMIHDADFADVDFQEENFMEFCETVEPKLSILHEIMLDAKPPGVTQSIFESTPQKSLPFGSLRLKIIEFIVLLLHVNSQPIYKKIIELQIIPCYIDLFFKYQWNNLLHSFIYSMIVRIFSEDVESGDDLILNALREGKLTDKIVEAARDNEADVEERKGLRRGYMGHLILLSNFLVRYSATPGILEEIQKYFQAENWKDFEKLILTETNQRDNKLLGGHRPIHPVGHDNFLQAALNDGDTSADQFARFLCHQITADLPDKFGEEEDDDFEIEDDVPEKPNFNAAGAYAGPITNEEFDDSDDELDSPQNEGWANFDSPVNFEQDDLQGKV